MFLLDDKHAQSAQRQPITERETLHMVNVSWKSPKNKTDL